MEESGSIRTMELDDYREARALWEASPGIALSAADSEARIASFLEHNPGLSKVWMCAGHLRGTILVGSDGRRGYLHHLVVAQAWRGFGAARALVDAALEALQAQGIDKCHTFVLAENREAASFWHHIGFAQRNDLLMYSRFVGD